MRTPLKSTNCSTHLRTEYFLPVAELENLKWARRSVCAKSLEALVVHPRELIHKQHHQNIHEVKRVERIFVGFAELVQVPTPTSRTTAIPWRKKVRTRRMRQIVSYWMSFLHSSTLPSCAAGSTSRGPRVGGMGGLEATIELGIVLVELVMNSSRRVYISPFCRV